LAKIRAKIWSQRSEKDVAKVILLPAKDTFPNGALEKLSDAPFGISATFR
jgi:hypothetical protein